MFTDNSFTDDSVEEEEARPKRKRKLKIQKRDDHQKKSTLLVNEQPSVYSSAEIRRHEKRLKRLKALENGSESETESESENENVDPDLDINLRIFESSMASIENVIIGEIQCNVKDDKAATNDLVEKGNKNSSVFKLSVNANFNKNSVEQLENIKINYGEKSDVDEQINASFPVSSCDEFTDNDSDLEILMSKPLIRKRNVPTMKKDKPLVESADKKRTMYDLLFDTSTGKGDDTTDEDEPSEGKNTSKKKNVDKKAEVKNEVPTEVVEKLEPTESSEKLQLAVPQLKVTADGEVVVDMDSLVVEQTGLSEARNAIANSEVIEECGFTHTSYSKKRSVPKQWSPQDTVRFYDVLSTIGTDFTMMATLFPGRTRTCMKRKFKREEKVNADLVLKALSCRQNFDLGLLERELRIKEERVNKLRENSRAQQALKNVKKNDDVKKSRNKTKRKSFFANTIQQYLQR